MSRVTGRLLRIGAYALACAVGLVAVTAGGSRTEPAQAGVLDFLKDVVTAAPGVHVVTSLFSEAAKGFGGQIVQGFASLMEYLFGGMLSTLTLGFVKFLVTIDLDFSGSLTAVVGPMYVIGAFFLMIGLMIGSIQAMHAVASGRDTAQHAFSLLGFKICVLALAMGAWHTILPFMASLANGMSNMVLNDHAVEVALQKSFLVAGGGAAAFGGAGAASCATTGVGCVVTPVILLILLLLLAITVVTVLIMKYILAFGFAIAFVGGPVAIGAGGVPGVGEPALNMLVRSVCVFMLIPLVWCICFATWAGVMASTIDRPRDVSDGLLQVVNGPGMFVAAMLVLLGVTRKLLQMSMPLGAPLGLPGPVKMALAAVAFKVGGPAVSAAMDKFTGGGSGGDGADGSLTEQQMVSAWTDSVHNVPLTSRDTGGAAATSDEPLAGAGSSDSGGGDTETATASSTSDSAGSTDAVAASDDREPAAVADRGAPATSDADLESARIGAQQRIDGLRSSGAQLDTGAAWGAMNASEQTLASNAASNALAAGPDAAAQQAAYERAMVENIAAGGFANPHAAAVLATASPADVQGYAAAAPPVPPAPRKVAPTLADHIQKQDFQATDLIGGADLASLRPPPPPPPQ
ncbi:MAG TPA: hypothetical protein VGO80_03565 [Solirubrobacteraceae bacterium]|nr:hypothetical protein [Solirubrobacteraceae bacterium]